MDVDEARRDNQPAGVDRPPSRRRIGRQGANGSDADVAAVTAALCEAHLTQGTGVESFEVEAVRAVAARQAVAFSRATAALRRAAYEQMVSGFRQTMSGTVDPTNPLDRKFMDDVAGAINRREIAQQPYDDEVAAYQEFLGGRRGGVARLCSARARTDWKASD